jgi:small subunit ribosomal protein S8
MGPEGVTTSREGTDRAFTGTQYPMVINDPVGDMITRIRNAQLVKHDKLTLPSSKLKVEIAKALKSEGFIADFVVHEKAPQNELTVVLKYGPNREPVITGIKRESKPGLRKYVNVRDIPRVRGGMGVAILSTSRGVMVDTEARKANVGGELICTVY